MLLFAVVVRHMAQQNRTSQKKKKKKKSRSGCVFTFFVHCWLFLGCCDCEGFTMTMLLWWRPPSSPHDLMMTMMMLPREACQRPQRRGHQGGRNVLQRWAVVDTPPSPTAGSRPHPPPTSQSCPHTPLRTTPTNKTRPPAAPQGPEPAFYGPPPPLLVVHNPGGGESRPCQVPRCCFQGHCLTSNL